MGHEVDNIFIVLGMYRSGTSALTGCLNLLGMDLGERVMEATTGNPCGSFENIDINAIHERLFSDLGHAWDMVGELPKNWLLSAAAKSAASDLEHILATQFMGKRAWAIKDPRMCRLLPLWNDLFRKMGLKPNYILMVRNPIEVAYSLHKRDDMDFNKACLLWITHNMEAMYGMMQSSYVVSTYDQLVTNSISLLKNIFLYFKIDFSFNCQELNAKIFEFIQPQLKSSYVKNTVSNTEFDFQPYTQVYRLLQEKQVTTNSAILVDADQSVADIAVAYDQGGCSSLTEIGTGTVKLAPADQETQATLTALREEVTAQKVARVSAEKEVQTTKSLFEQKVAAQAGQLQEAQAALTKLREDIANLANKLKDRYCEIATLTALLQEAETKQTEMRSNIMTAGKTLTNTLDKTAVQNEILRLDIIISGLVCIIKSAIDIFSQEALENKKYNTYVKNMILSIRKLELVDEKWYLETYSDVREAGLDPVNHYISHGAAEQRAYGPKKI